MGLFDIFKKKPAEVAVVLPVVKTDKRIYHHFDIAFFSIMKDIVGFNEKEIKEIHKIISSGEFLNLNLWHSRIFPEYFSGRDWDWKEFKYWDKKFSEIGKFPIKWGRIRNLEGENLTPNYVFGKMKVADLKEFLCQNNIEIPPKSKKEDLLKLVELIPNLDKFPFWIEQEKERKNQKGYILYSQLCLHIISRSIILYDLERMKLSGTDFEWQILMKEDKEFIDLALKLKKDAIPPFFPTDMTSTIPIIDFEKM